MAKFSGMIGFVVTEEDLDNPGVWEEKVVERKYRGELLKNTIRTQPIPNSTNDNITLSNTISIIADPYATNNMFAIRYVVLHNVKWKIDTVEVEYPRLKLTIGGIYNV